MSHHSITHIEFTDQYLAWLIADLRSDHLRQHGGYPELLQTLLECQADEIHLRDDALARVQS